MLLTTVVAVAVALAFADSSVVVLALPELYGQFDTTIVGVSWVITSYNVAIAVAALALVPFVRRLRAPVLAAVGFVTFAAASLVCGLTSSFTVLLAGRCVQGVGGALLLAGSLPLLVGLTEHAPRARAVWGLAGTVGAALGPALGGLLTQLFSWRSIFLLQAPIAALALVAVANRAVRRAAHDRPGPMSLRMVVANLGFLLLFAALVGALFLAVLLVIVVWGLTPIEGALVVSTLPVGALLVRFVVPGLPAWLAAAAGGALLAGGLLGLAFLPASSPAYAMPALGFCGCGLGMLSGVLGPEALPHGAGLLRSATLSIGARHLGFVLGLVVIAPLLAGQLEHSTLQAEKATAAVILDGRIGIREKVPLTLDLRTLVESTPRGQVPNLNEPFDKRGAATRPELRRVRDDLHEAISSTITRAFRSSFGVAALFAALAAVPALGLAVVRRRTA